LIRANIGSGGGGFGSCFGAAGPWSVLALFEALLLPSLLALLLPLFFFCASIREREAMSRMMTCAAFIAENALMKRKMQVGKV